MPVENYIYLIAQDSKSFINLVDQYISVLYITQLLVLLMNKVCLEIYSKCTNFSVTFNDSCKHSNEYMVFNSMRGIHSTML